MLLSLLSRQQFTNGLIDLRLTGQDVTSDDLGIIDGYLFHIYRHHGLHKMGYISLRLKALLYIIWVTSVTGSIRPTGATGMPARPASCSGR